LQQIREQALKKLPPRARGLLDGAPFGDGDHTLALIDPDGAEEVGRLQENTADEVARAVESAARAFRVGTWSGGRISERAATLRRAAELIRRDGDEIAALDSLTTGLLWHGSTRRHAAAAADWFDYFADSIECEPETRFDDRPGIATRSYREPGGGRGALHALEHPLMAAGLKLSAALAMGNSVVVKPSELSPLGTGRLVELLHEAGLPVGVVQLVNGRGITTGAALAAHPDVGCISFTGGPQAGAAIAAAASARFAKVTMELGGKVREHRARRRSLRGRAGGSVVRAFGNSGQACLADRASWSRRRSPSGSSPIWSARTERFGSATLRSAGGARAAKLPRADGAGPFLLSRSPLGGAEILCGGKRAAGLQGFQSSRRLRW
jgi:acyl-CoA reductase-like NAD-dependent aldehyde dehydrogenase